MEDKEINEINYKALEQNIWDSVKEEQVKLGYRREVIRLYYPLKSLNGFLGTNCSRESMYPVLKEFAKRERDTLGEIYISNELDRFCLRLSEEASTYIHEHTSSSGFLYDFIAVIARHGSSMDDVLDVFHKYSGHVHDETLDNGEFDRLVYFEDGVPDAYRYCLTDEGHHIIYHRFTAEDYEELGL